MKCTQKYVYKINKNIHKYLCILPIDYAQIFVYNTVTRSNKTDLHKINQTYLRR